MTDAAAVDALLDAYAAERSRCRAFELYAETLRAAAVAMVDALEHGDVEQLVAASIVLEQAIGGR